MEDRKLYGKIIFRGVIKALTGLHVGASKETMEIGGLDSPVIKNPATGEPYIPGSSLKGKLRSLLELKLHTEGKIEFNRDIGRPGNRILVHVCDSEDDAFECEVCRIFGTSGKGEKPDGTPNSNFPARIKVRDAEFTEYSRRYTENETEIKFENSLDRITSASNPRQIERVPAGSEFELEIIYNVEDLNQLKDDIQNLLYTMELLEDDALGGHGSRGYGKVKFYFYNVAARPIESYFGKDGARNIVDIDWKSHESATEKDLKKLHEIRKRVGDIVASFAKVYGGNM